MLQHTGDRENFFFFLLLIEDDGVIYTVSNIMLVRQNKFALRMNWNPLIGGGQSSTINNNEFIHLVARINRAKFTITITLEEHCQELEL